MIIILDPKLVSQQAISGTIEALTLLDTAPETLSKDDKNIVLRLKSEHGAVRPEDIKAMPGVAHVCMDKAPQTKAIPFSFQGMDFNESSCHLFAGLNAIGSISEAQAVFEVLANMGLSATRVGVYKPRTFPNSFQGLGDAVLADLFSLADKFGIKTIAMEVMSEHDICAVREALGSYKVNVMWQIGTRNAQNYSLLRYISQDTTRPILYKRGFGNEISELVGGVRYLQRAGANVITCLRGVKSAFAAPARNMSDFSQIPLVKRETGTYVCADPSHSHGMLGPDKVTDIHHLGAQAVIAGANMLLLDVHPNPLKSKVDGRQSLSLAQLPGFHEDMQLVHETYLKRMQIAERTYEY